MRWAVAVLILGLVVVAPAALLSRTAPGPTSAHGRATQLDNQHHLYVLDGHGGIDPVGDSPGLKPSVTWPNKDVAYSLALFADGKGGYVLNAWGGLDPVGDARAVESGLAGIGFGVARQVVLAPWATQVEPAGYILDGYGTVHAFGDAPPVADAAHFAADLARGMIVMSRSTREHVAGYTLDAHGTLHPFGGAPAVTVSAYWPADDAARGVMLERGTTAGFVLDRSGGLHPFGGETPVAPSATWPGQDLADSILAWSGASIEFPGGWVLDRHGGVHAYGSAPRLSVYGIWPAWDIARGLGSSGGGGGGSKERTLVDPETLSDAWGTYFNQRDARWGANPVGYTPWPVWEIGCVLSSIAMVYAHFGFSGVTPATVAARGWLFYGDGEITNAGFDIPGHPATVNRHPTGAWIGAQVDAGRPVIVGMNLPGGGTHFLVLTGRNGASDYWADDPWDQNGMHVQFSGDWDDRGTIYEAIAYS